MKIAALAALLLLIPVPSLAVFFGLILYPHTLLGQTLFILGKCWVLLLPITWYLVVEKNRLSFNKPSVNSLLVGLLSGLLIALIIYGSYLLFHAHIDLQALRNVAVNVGLDSKKSFLLLALYWVWINALLEEYVWRWFVIEQCKKFLTVRLAVLMSALGFTLHHVIATQIYFSGLLVVLASIGVFSGGLIWAWMYTRYHTIWPSYISHILADVAIFAIGYQMIFTTAA